jgi:hypothetical protein
LVTKGGFTVLLITNATVQKEFSMIEGKRGFKTLYVFELLFKTLTSLVSKDYPEREILVDTAPRQGLSIFSGARHFL